MQPIEPARYAGAIQDVAHWRAGQHKPQFHGAAPVFFDDDGGLVVVLEYPNRKANPYTFHTIPKSHLIYSVADHPSLIDKLTSGTSGMGVRELAVGGTGVVA